MNNASQWPIFPQHKCLIITHKIYIKFGLCISSLLKNTEKKFKNTVSCKKTIKVVKEKSNE